MGEPRRYRSDDRDLEGHDLEIVVLPPDGNGDWYVSIVEHGHKIGPTVRVTTSGAPNGQHMVCVAVSKLYRAMGGESIQDEAGDDLAAFLRLRDGEVENEEVASLRTEVKRLTAERDEAKRDNEDMGEVMANQHAHACRLAADVSRLTRQLADETTRANLWEAIAKRLGAGSQ